MTAQQTITCPECRHEFELTESLAAPLIAEMQQEFEARLAKKDAEAKRRDVALKQREDALLAAEDAYEEQLAERLRAEREKIATEEGKKAKRALAGDMAEKARELAEMQALLAERDTKLSEAQKAQAEYLRKGRELDEAKREMALTIEKQVAEGLAATRESARKEVQDELQLKVNEKEHTIAAMQKQIEDLKRRAEQGSQQLQGEVQELELEAVLNAKFPTDVIAPVPKGEFGGDALQTVHGPLRQVCGSILWESKRTKNWGGSWLGKLKDDQRAAKAEIAVLVSRALPEGIDSFDYLEGVWVTHPRTAVAVAVCLRESLIEVAQARQAGVGQQSKMEEMYQYLTGPVFRQRVQVLVESFTSMQDDLAKERKVITRQWAKREKELERMLVATTGLHGDLQGIAGQSIQEIEGLGLDALEFQEDDG